MRVVVLRAVLGVALAGAVGQAVAGCGSDSKDSTATTKPSAASTSATAATPECSTVAGSAAPIAKPGVGEVSVTIEVCGKAVKSASAAISLSNWEPRNTDAVASLNQLAVQHFKTDLSKITFSGATLTSNAYQTSLKEAVAKAGI